MMMMTVGDDNMECYLVLVNSNLIKVGDDEYFPPQVNSYVLTIVDDMDDDNR